MGHVKRSLKKKDLAVPKGKKVAGTKRPPDLVSKRGVPYHFAPEWIRDVGRTVGRVRAVKTGGSVDLYMLSKDGNLSYIEGSIQQEFHRWCEEQQFDCLLLGIEMEDVLGTDWEYV
jgi:hypothetical protein